MAQFEIFVPAAPPAQVADVVLLLQAESWLGALRAGVARIGGRHPANVLCDVRPGGAIHVTDPETGRAFREAILARRGSQEPMVLFVDFRGREPSIDALLRHLGLVAEAAA
jgi:hypothetical protein